MTDSVKPTGWKASDSPVKRAFARSRLVQVAAGVMALLVLDRRALLGVDWGLLVTFAAFFT